MILLTSDNCIISLNGVHNNAGKGIYLTGTAAASILTSNNTTGNIGTNLQYNILTTTAANNIQ